jgi:hypothetical protein
MPNEKSNIEQNDYSRNKNNNNNDDNVDMYDKTNIISKLQSNSKDHNTKLLLNVSR